MAGGNSTVGGGGCAWSRRVAVRLRTLRGLVRDTQRALHNVADILHFDPEVSTAVQEVGNLASRSTALVIFGTSASARVRLLHSLLGRRLLPDTLPRGCRWLRIQYGSSTQVHLTLGNSDFELIEELECNKQQWETLPLQDLIRQDQTDLATMLEIELNNSFLKDGLRIIIPPDIDQDPGPDHHQTLKRLHFELYTKRELILKNFNPVYLYAIDRTGKNIFSDNICGLKLVSSASDEDFWSACNFYSVTRSSAENDEIPLKNSEVVSEVFKEGNSEPAVFTGEHCLDLHQTMEINPNSQIFFILFSNSTDISMDCPDMGRVQHCMDATESAERVFKAEELPESDQGLIQDGVLRHSQQSREANKAGVDNRRLMEEQTAFMNDLLDQWELMSSPPLKHHVKSQWMIFDDAEVLNTNEKPVVGYLTNVVQNATAAKTNDSERDDDIVVKSRVTFLNKVLKFASDCLHSYLLEFCTKLSEMHVKLLQQFILASFELARELQVVPKKIHYVAKQEQHLYESINEKFSEGEKKEELMRIMQEVLQEMKTEVFNMDWRVDDLPCHQDKRFHISNSVFYSSRSSPDNIGITDRTSSDQIVSNHSASDLTPLDVEEAVSYDSYNFDEYDIIHSNDESLIASDCYRSPSKTPALPDDSISITSQIGHIQIENEDFSLSSAWTNLAHSTASTYATTCTSTTNVSVKQASLDVQQTVLAKLSRKISLRLVKFVDCLRDSYFGTLQRCLESLESSCRQELGGRPASEAMRQLLSVARQVDLQPCASFSVLRSLLESIKRLFHKLRVGGSEAEESCCVFSPVWRRQVALQTTMSLTPQRLARLICSQILERLSTAHERYQAALSSLEAALAGRLHHTEDVKLAIRKKYAPDFARLCLESTSMCDLLMYGTPELGREIGRGQYGVVYSVRGAWGGHSPVAVKSVLPAEERHYNELAMEFFYTRSIPAHPRIVRLHGSVVQRNSGVGPTVLLVSERKCRDLHAAVRTGLPLPTRMRISCDIVEGIRYLHSLGLVHRDIKMKNVLLDSEDRAALSDLGFCAAEALMSGSVVGTPVHMAPELLAGEYHAAVDVYAFGILFWYVCAGNVKLPSAFEIFQNKEQLWSKVKRGLRPERLPHFSDECWEVMESCWASEPSQRALLGDIQPKLEKILEQTLRESQGQSEVNDYRNRGYDESDDDSLEITGNRHCL